MKAIIAGIAAAALLAACTTPGESPVSPASSSSAAVKSALAAVSAQVSEASLRGYIEKMVSFGTRHTLSDTTSNTRGIGAARRWVESEFKGMSAACGNCLEVIMVQDTITSPPRVPNPTVIANVVAIQRGTTDPNRVIIIQGHLDSRVTDPLNFTSDAPGANDDASGVAAVMESARVLSKRKFGATLVFAALSGEEQGLHGGRILAAYAKTQGWEVLAVLNNDIVGNSHGLAAHVDNRVRVFSEGVRSNESEDDRRRPPLRRRRSRRPLAQSRALHGRHRAGTSAGLRRLHGLPPRSLQPWRRPGADGRSRLPRRPRHRSRRELHPPAPGPAHRRRHPLRRHHRRRRFSLSRARHETQRHDHGLARLRPAAAARSQSRRRRLRQHHRDVDRQRKRRQLHRLVARHDLARLAAQPDRPRQRNQHRPRECRHRRLVLRRAGRLSRRLCQPGAIRRRRRRVLPPPPK